MNKLDNNFKRHFPSYSFYQIYVTFRKKGATNFESNKNRNKSFLRIKARLLL